MYNYDSQNYLNLISFENIFWYNTFFLNPYNFNENFFLSKGWAHLFPCLFFSNDFPLIFLQIQFNSLCLGAQVPVSPDLDKTRSLLHHPASLLRGPLLPGALHTRSPGEEYSWCVKNEWAGSELEVETVWGPAVGAQRKWKGIKVWGQCLVWKV